MMIGAMGSPPSSTSSMYFPVKRGVQLSSYLPVPLSVTATLQAGGALVLRSGSAEVAIPSTLGSSFIRSASNDKSLYSSVAVILW